MRDIMREYRNSLYVGMTVFFKHHKSIKLRLTSFFKHHMSHLDRKTFHGNFEASLVIVCCCF